MAAPKKTTTKPSTLPVKAIEMPAVSSPQSIVKSPADLAIMARFVTDSKFYPKLNEPAKSAVVIKIGMELGIQEMMATQLIHPIMTNDGPKLVIESKLLAMIAMQGGVRWKIIQKDPTACILEFYSLRDKTLNPHREQFTIEDAKRAGLDQKKNWIWYPEEMCYNRCLKKGLTVFDPRIGGGYYTLEEARDFEPINETEVADELAAEVIPDAETAPDQNAVETRGEEDFSKLPPNTTLDKTKAEDLGMGLASEQREQQAQQQVTAPDPPDQGDIDADDGFMPYGDEPTTEELKPGTKDLAPATPTDPGILIYKQMIIDYMKVQQMEHLYPQFKEFLSIFQTSRSPMKNFVARNQFGAWSMEKGSKADLKVLTDNLHWTIERFIEHCFKVLGLAKVGMYDNPALKPEQD